MKYSFIIPLYNSEQYIKETINSITCQSYDDIEVVIVDDGSTDNSCKVIEELMESDKRIKLFKNSNHGVAYSRNYGVTKASGEYIIFMDSDDYWNDSDALNNIDKIIDGKDMVIFGYNNLINGEIVQKTNFASLTNDSMQELMDREVYTSSSCLKVIRKDIIVANNINFIENYYVEDIEWNLRLAIYASNYAIYKENVYIYRQSDNSRSRQLSMALLNDYYDTIAKCVGYINDSGREDLYGYVAYNYLILLARAYKTELMPKLKSYSYLLKKSNNKKVKLGRLVKMIVGYRVLCMVLNKYIMEK